MDHHEFAVLTVGGASVGGEPASWLGICRWWHWLTLRCRCLPEEADEAVVGGIRGEVVGGEFPS
jgi:hypothetical protein